MGNGDLGERAATARHPVCAMTGLALGEGTGEGAASPHQARALHVDVLDGVRGVAALIVVASHLSQATGLFAGHFSGPGGQIGVMLFFALSGFLLAHIYLGQSVSVQSLRDYAVARIARVLPLFYLIVLASYIFASGPIALYDVTDTNLSDHLWLYSGVSVLWTIPVEIRFYCLFPLIWLLWRWSEIAATLTVAGILIAYYAIEPGTMPVMKLGHYFLVGILVRIVLEFSGRGQRNQSTRQVRVSDAFFIAAGILFALLLVRPLPIGNDPRIWWNPLVAVAIFGLLLSAIGSRVAGRMIGNRIMRFLGRISYGVYLLHMLVILNLRSLIDPKAEPTLFIALVLSITVLFSWLVYRGFEAPTRRFMRDAFGSRLPRRIGGRRTG